MLDAAHGEFNLQNGSKHWTLVRQRIELLELSGQWEILWDFCRALLDDAYRAYRGDTTVPPNYAFGSFGDDWKAWTGFVDAHSHIYTTGQVSKGLPRRAGCLTLAGNLRSQKASYFHVRHIHAMLAWRFLDSILQTQWRDTPQRKQNLWRPAYSTSKTIARNRSAFMTFVTTLSISATLIGGSS